MNKKAKTSILKFKYLVLALGIFCFENVLADTHRTEIEAEFEAEFKGLSLPQIKDVLKQQLGQLEEWQDLSSFKLSASPESETIEVVYTEQFDPIPAATSNAKYQDYFNSIGFVQNIAGDTSYLETNYRKYDLYENVGRISDFEDTPLQFKIERAQFVSHAPALPVIVTKSGEANVESVQRISALEATATYSLPEQVKRFYFNHKSNASQNEIELIAINGSEVVLTMPREVYDNILRVEAMDKQGKALQYQGSSAHFNNINKFFDQLHNFLSDAIERIDSGKIDNRDQLLAFFVDNFPPEEEVTEDNPPKTIASYYFSGQAIAVTVFMKPEYKEYHYTFALKPREDHYINGVTVGMDSSQKTYGLIDEQGVWVIEPKYGHLESNLGDYYSVVQVNGDRYNSQIYFLNRTDKKLEEQPFNMMNTELYQDKFVIINNLDSNNTHIYGLLNIETNQILLPVEYDRVIVDGSFYIGMNYNNKTEERSYSIYRQSDSKQILNGVFNNVVVDGVNIITQSYVDPKDHQVHNSIGEAHYYTYYDIYNVDGTKLNSESYFDLQGDFGIDGLIPVIDTQGGHYYIDRQAKTADFDLSEYQAIEGFSNGLAAVQGKNGQYGYINTQGKLAIPLMYKSANYFQGGTALVYLEGGQYQLITPDNQVVTTFTKSLGAYSSEKDGQEASYSFIVSESEDEDIDDVYETYDHRGVLVP